MTGTLRLQGVTISLAGRNLFQRLDLVAEPGQTVTVMGPSGCGKSSLLAYICGTLDRAFAATGGVSIGDTDVTGLTPERRGTGILFQDDLLFPHLSVAENLAFGLPASLRGRKARLGRIEAALADAGLSGFGDRDPATLSGGQRARVALLRTLLSEPRALLLDEPFAKLDIGLRARIRAFVFDHVRDRGLPALLVTHDPADAEAAAGPVVTLAPAGDEDPEEAAAWTLTGPSPARMP
jgi:putative thiamine transport system ATP-binding protein